MKLLGLTLLMTLTLVLASCRAPEMTTQVRHGGVTYVFDNGMFRAVSRGPGVIEFVGPTEAADFTARGGRLVRDGVVIEETVPGDTVRVRPDGVIEVSSPESESE